MRGLLLKVSPRLPLELDQRQMAALAIHLKAGPSDQFEVGAPDGTSTGRANEALCDGNALFAIFFSLLHD
jgi:hypothetical protein